MIELEKEFPRVIQIDAEEEFRQAALKGVWRNKDGCPHCVGRENSVDLCEEMEMTACLYETGSGPCDTFQEVLEEWRIDLAICPECFETRPGDKRIADGLECNVCACVDSYQEFEDAGVMPGGMLERATQEEGKDETD